MIKFHILFTWVALTGVTMAQESGAFLGVAARSLHPEEISTLPDGIGLRVVEVVPDSPAALELETGDVLHKLGDQLLIDPRQLAVLVGLHSPGEVVELTWLRQGVSRSANLTLAKRPPRPRMQPLPVRPYPGLGLGDRGLSPILPRGFEEMEERMRDMERRMEALTRDMDQLVPSAPLSGNESGFRRTQWTENGRSMTLEQHNQKATLVIEEDGNVIFEGPVNTPEQRAKVPEAYQVRLEKLFGDMAGEPGEML